jgi:hypothetical protein
MESSFRIGLDGISHQAAKPERMESSFRIGLDGISYQAAKPEWVKFRISSCRI